MKIQVIFTLILSFFIAGNSFAEMKKIKTWFNIFNGGTEIAANSLNVNEIFGPQVDRFSGYDRVIVLNFGETNESIKVMTTSKKLELLKPRIVSVEKIDGLYSKVNAEFSLEIKKNPELETLDLIAVSSNSPYAKNKDPIYLIRLSLDIQSGLSRDLVTGIITNKISKPYPARIVAKVFYMDIPEQKLENGILHYKGNVKVLFTEGMTNATNK